VKIAGQDVEVHTTPYHGGWMSVAYLPDGKQVASAPWDTREAAENDVYQQALMRLAPMPKFDPTKTYEQQIAERRANALLEHCGHCPEDFDEPLENPECPACGGPGVPLGSLGRRMHFRCRNCGYDFSQEPPEPPITEGERVTIKGRPWGMKPGTKARVSRVFKNRKEGMGYDAEVRAKGWHPMRVKWKDVERVKVQEAGMKCECSDPGCPVCHGHCSNAARTNLLRIDMNDEGGTLFCNACADDALASGVFREDRGAYIRATTRNPRPPRVTRRTRYIPPPKASFYPGSGGSAGVGGVTSA
jgi:hypothetical protein